MTATGVNVWQKWRKHTDARADYASIATGTLEDDMAVMSVSSLCTVCPAASAGAAGRRMPPPLMARRSWGRVVGRAETLCVQWASRDISELLWQCGVVLLARGPLGRQPVRTAELHRARRCSSGRASSMLNRGIAVLS